MRRDEIPGISQRNKDGSVTVEASSAEEAKVMADEAYRDGKVRWRAAALELRSLKKETDRGEVR